MIESSDIKKFAQHAFARSKGVPDKHIMHPQREWLLIMAIFLLVFAAGAAHGWYQYQFYQQYADEVTAQSDTTIPTYHDALIQNAHDTYAQRGERFEEYLASPALTGATDDIATSTPSAGEEGEEGDDDEDDTTIADDLAEELELLPLEQ